MTDSLGDRGGVDDAAMEVLLCGQVRSVSSVSGPCGAAVSACHGSAIARAMNFRGLARRRISMFETETSAKGH